MILQALHQYYERLLTDPNVGVSEFGFSRQGVHFCLPLDREGNLAGAPLDLRDDKGRAKRVEVPGPIGRSVGVASNFAWDNTGYVLGVDSKGKPERTAKTHAAFKELAAKVLSEVDDDGASALLAFLEQWKSEQAEELTGYEELLDQNVVFRLDGDLEFIHERPAFRKAWVAHLAGSANSEKGMCLVTGEDSPIPPTHAKIKGVPGAQTSGASLVSFNFDAAVSFGKKQNFNAPVSDKAAFAYTTALNYLLDPANERKVQVGDTTVVFWTDGPSGDAAPMFGFALGGKAPEDEGLAQRLTGHIKSIARGRLPEELGDPKTRFYVLGLSPNAARLSVRFWHVGTVGDTARNLGEHYAALVIKREYNNQPEHPSPWWILRELAPQRDSRNISPLLSGQLLKAILGNRPYPRTLLTSAIERVRADSDSDKGKKINYLRAAIIKAYLVRNAKQEIQMTLDKDNTDIGYRLGRLFAIVERIQEQAVPGANASVKDRFFGSASATPARTFPIILRNAQHGLAKIRKENHGLAVYYEKGIQEITAGIDPKDGFPASLALEKQGMFILGYYQQRQAMFTKNEDKTEE